MRLHRLRLAAFGPFATEQDVDFDELSAAGLFLLHGPTGAGKTSVLDAVCFALYGQVPGARPASRLRSDHAAPGTPTEVVLELTLAGRRLEITRRPEQPRAKKRGSGVTMEKAVTLLREQVEGQWRGLSKSHQEIGEEIRQLVGMSCEQFCQVVLLPQGEFATFLRASATERGALLGRLFDTRRFKSVENRLKELRNEAAQRLVQGDRDLVRLAARMRQAAGEDDPEGAAPADDDPDFTGRLLEWAAVRRCTARERRDIALAAVDQAERDHTAAASAADDARALHALQQRHAEAVRRAADLALRGPARTGARTTLGRAHQAAGVAPALALRDTAAARHREAAALADHTTAELAAAGEPRPATAPSGAPRPRLPAQTSAADHRNGAPSEPDRPAGAKGPRGARAVAGAGSAARAGIEVAEGSPAGQAAAADAPVPYVDVLTRRAGEVREVLGGLARAADAEARVAELAERRARLEREERTDEEAVREAHGWLDRWPELRSRLQTRLDGALEAAARAGESAGELAAARRRRDAAVERDALAAESARAEDAARDARDRTAQAREAWQDLREARISGIAAELAADLADGEPCRVCGSAAHPEPARPADRQVTRADEDAAYAGFQIEAGGYERVRDTVAGLRAALEAATATAGDESQAELAAACAAREAEHAAAAREAATVPEARGALSRAEEERDRRAAQRQDALSRSAARTSRREELDQQYDQLSAELDRARSGHPSVAARRAQLTSAVALLDRAVRALTERTDSARLLAEAESAVTEAAVRAGFGSAEEAAEALLPPSRLGELEHRAEVWAKEEAAVEADLTAPETAAAAARPAADPAAAQAALDAANHRLRAASAAESAAATRCAELDRLGAESAAAARRLAPARADFDRVARLSDLASATTAQNRYRMELETYVLAARLEQIAAAAGVRLERMSAGRYTLVHTDARGGGRAKSGLGLMVVDAWTGTERDTSTLSGGETFFASLALALGLADVVTDEAGGMRLDTLFIDEGFGSLDEQTLDEVLDVLDGLRERDRAVGIVSHVADLRHRVPTQLHVIKGRDGSAVRMRTR